jgi:hypothetical protein
MRRRRIAALQIEMIVPAADLEDISADFVQSLAEDPQRMRTGKIFCHELLPKFIYRKNAITANGAELGPSIARPRSLTRPGDGTIGLMFNVTQ